MRIIDFGVSIAISLNVADIFKFFRERGMHDRTAVLAYLEEMSAAAKELADLWCNALAALPDAERSNQLKFGKQTFLCTQIEGFYENATKVIAGRLEPEHHERLFDLLGTFLKNRRQTTILHCRVMSEYLKPMSKRQEAEIIEQARQFGNMLQANAADLQVLVSEIRAQV